MILVRFVFLDILFIDFVTPFCLVLIFDFFLIDAKFIDFSDFLQYQIWEFYTMPVDVIW